MAPIAIAIPPRLMMFGVDAAGSTSARTRARPRPAATAPAPACCASGAGKTKMIRLTTIAFLEQRVPQGRRSRARSGSSGRRRCCTSTPGGNDGRELGELLLHALDHVQRVLASSASPPCRPPPRPRRPAPETPRRMSGPNDTGADVADADRRAAARSAPERHLAQVVQALHVAAPAHEVLAPRHLDHAAADVGVAAPDRGR